MKLSNKILLSIFVLIFASIVTMMVTVRLDIGDVKAAIKEEPETFEIPVEPFESVTIEKNARIILIEGDSYGLKVIGHKLEAVNLNISTQVNAGNLEFKFPENYGKERHRHKIQLTTPKVKKIILKDNARLTVRTLDQDSLKIDLSDQAELTAKEIAVDYLAVKATSQTRLRSNNCMIKQVAVILKDKSECALFNLDGASITGTLEEHSLLQLSGWTAKLNVDLDKKARIIKRD
ncbi:DUF2807 domain-containing protein [Fulvivirgaceae bacterium BMA12]|uniref:DUF2807 domain-containing protein n=1 Tax=Agaribacillus aureus TaxID=3051825 RepID=A0ABT8L976_9BACT|nr:DUF2807 domain-containing protein [Fulvivirgaceae bacterium BMA12]